MILAAGRGERLRPLTDTIPKPLVQVGRLSLLEWHLENCQRAGISDVVINVSYLGEQIKNSVVGQDFGVNIVYSDEPDGALETGGGIMQALPLFDGQAFIVINSDIWTDYPLEQLRQPQGLAHLVMVDNPPQHPQGDFVLQQGQLHNRSEGKRYTYSGIGVYRPELFTDCQPGRFPLAPLLKQAMQSGQVSGEYFAGQWYDIGTPDRLQQARDLVE